MVSLTNFRTVSELTLREQDAQSNQLSFSSASTQPDTNSSIETNKHQQQQANNNNNNINNNINNIYNNNNSSSQVQKPQQLDNNIHDKTTLDITSAKNCSIGQTPKQHLNMASKQQQQQQSEHFEIRWTNLSYQVAPKWYRQRLANWTNSNASPKHKTTILNGLSGSVRSGQVSAILGPSGAGKTSLLGCLLGKHKSGVSGCVQVISSRAEPLSICTIPQKDFLLNQLTVRENLWFASRLKHPESGFEHNSNIERVVDLLKLESCIDTRISKVSGGQHKRVSIAQELLSNPDILILDEPTSGLDSLTCYKTVMVLRDLARLSPNPMAIIVTIHQPQREVFDLFNHVYILAVGGRCIFEGEPSNSISTINKHGAGLSFDAEQYNPASYLVEIASSEFGEKPIESLVQFQQQDFKRQAIIRDNTIQQQQANQPYGRLFNGTPNLKKRQSPMVARFKSTLSSLSPKLGPNSNVVKQFQHQQHQQQHQAAFAYANPAFDNNNPPTVQVTDYTNKLDASHQLKLPLNDLIQPNATSEISIIHSNCDPIQKLQHELRFTDCHPIVAANGEPIEEGEFYLDDRLQTHKHNHRGHFLRHCQLLTKRSWLCLCKDPMLTTLRFTAHIIVPLLITLVYGNQIGKPNACPLYETEMDLIEYARTGAKKLLNLQDELRCSFENVGLFFLSVYAFTFSTMCLTSLSFPLNMHVLLKEVRNGWYSLPTYFIGKTLADFPLEFILPVVTLMITYPLTGQPSSYLEWRFLLGTGVFVVTSLIAQTQGLIFGALFMNAMQAAVFVAPVSTTPLILLSGFLIRISQMPSYLQTLASFSYFRYAIESLTIIRYGFGMCPCDPSLVTGDKVKPSGVPDQLRSMTNYWLSTFQSAPADSLDANETATLGANDQPVDFFQDLTALLARANSFGTEIKTCDDLKPYPMIDFSLKDEQLYTWLVALVATLVASKIVNYLVVKYSVKWRL